MNIEFNKYYELDFTHSYYSCDLKRLIKFTNKIVVKCVSSHQNLYFGKLIDTSSINGSDFITNNEIEFTEDDIIGEYQLRDIPIHFIDFTNIEKGPNPPVYLNVNEIVNFYTNN